MPGRMDMAKLTVVTREGQESTIEAADGLSVMEVIRDAGFDELLALCGRCCSCATCHVFVDEAWADKLPLVGEDETDLIDRSTHRHANSRLSCHYSMELVLDGHRILIRLEEGRVGVRSVRQCNT